MTQEQKDALRASDPSAFDDDEASAEPEEDGDTDDGAGAAGADASAGAESATGATGAAAATGATGASGATGAAEGATGGATAGAGATGSGATAAAGTPKVPRGRLNEVIDERNQARERVNELEDLSRRQARELEELRTRTAGLKPPKDFDAEFNAVQERYKAGEIDEAEKDREIRRISREEATFIARQESLQTQTATTEANVARTWEEEVSAWSQDHPGFLADDGNAAVFQRALNAVVAFRGNDITNQQLLREAADMALRETGYEAPGVEGADAGAAAGATGAAAGATGAAPGKAAGDARRAQNARRASEAAGTPPPITGGVGTRGTSGEIDLKSMKPGSFSKLPKAEQEKLLGEGAL